MNIRDYDNYREHLSKAGIKPGLDRMRALCAKLGDPQNRLEFIHVAGTNGKGSVCAYISTILMEAGYKVGRFTSPAVMSEKERYWINGRNASGAALCRCMEEVKAAADVMALRGNEEPTLFEAECAMAFLLFAEAKCDIAVIECGMGGTNDATNVIGTPLAGVFTSISLDHTRYLGKTMEAIAREKSGIIKQSGRVVSAPQTPEVLSVLKARATITRSNLTVVDIKSVKAVKCKVGNTVFDYGRYKKLEINMSGTVQIENAALAVTVIEALRKSKIKVTEEQIREGLKKASWPGRFEVISKRPMVILDGAHNENAAERLAENVELLLKDKSEEGKIIYIFGVLADKNYPAISQIMAPYATNIITVTPPDNPRALSAVQLAETVRKYNENVSSADSLEEALEMAYLLANKDSVIIVFGSLSFLGEMKSIVEAKESYLVKKQMKV